MAVKKKRGRRKGIVASLLLPVYSLVSTYLPGWLNNALHSIDKMYQDILSFFKL